MGKLSDAIPGMITSLCGPLVPYFPPYNFLTILFFFFVLPRRKFHLFSSNYFLDFVMLFRPSNFVDMNLESALYVPKFTTTVTVCLLSLIRLLKILRSCISTTKK